MAKENPIIQKFKSLLQFVTTDIWRISETELTKSTRRLYTLLKALAVSIRRFREDDLLTRASALTYSTLLAIVPILALLFAIANGLGFKTLIETQLMDYFPGQKIVLEKGLEFASSYLENAKGGLFVGIGVIMLIWAIIVLISHIENAFNDIWLVCWRNRGDGRKRNRKFRRCSPSRRRCESGRASSSRAGPYTLPI